MKTNTSQQYKFKIKEQRAAKLISVLSLTLEIFGQSLETMADKWQTNKDLNL